MGIIIVFTILQTINVILQTVKTLVMARINNKHLSALINAVAYGFYVIVVQRIAHLDLAITITVTIITNVLGIYITYCIMDKMEKENLWKIEVFTKNHFRMMKFQEFLAKNGINFTENNKDIITIYSYKRENTKAIREYMVKNKAEMPDLLYNITEITKKL